MITVETDNGIRIECSQTEKNIIKIMLEHGYMVAEDTKVKAFLLDMLIALYLPYKEITIVG